MRASREELVFMDDFKCSGTLSVEDANGCVMFDGDPYDPGASSFLSDDEVPKLVQWLNERAELIARGRRPA